jgi:hypothetical protein
MASPVWPDNGGMTIFIATLTIACRGGTAVARTRRRF